MNPDYKKGSILNLMSSICHAFGTKTKYKPLKSLNTALEKTNIILLIIDGLGYYNLPNGFLKRNTIQKLTSVFPSTTVPAIPSIYTGMAPQETGMPGFDIYLKESNIIDIAIAHINKFTKKPVNQKITNLFSIKPIMEKIKAERYIFYHKSVADSKFTKAVAHRAKIIKYTTIKEHFNKILKASTGKKRKFIISHWLHYDILAHNYGIRHKKTLKHLKQLENITKKLSQKIKNTTIVITADHGMTKISKSVILEEHPKLLKLLKIPVCGDPRTVFCYVSNKKMFKHYIQHNLSHACEIKESKKLAKKGMFGLFTPHKKFYDRIGDYTLLMKPGYSLYSKRKPRYEPGNHGGTTKEEMTVPLIVLTCK